MGRAVTEQLLLEHSREKWTCGKGKHSAFVTGHFFCNADKHDYPPHGLHKKAPQSYAYGVFYAYRLP
jgi:hypothetical protein